MHFILMVLFVLCFSLSALAQEDSQQRDPQWLADKARMDNLLSEKLTEEEDCQIRWDILWSWSKKGNLEARATLFRLSYPFWPAIPQIFMPGRSGDDISSQRDAVILGIHSIGVQYKSKAEQDRYDELSDGIYNSFLNYGTGAGFLQCLKTTPKQECAYSAFTKARLVPRFEDYADEIDALVAQGMLPRCVYFRDTRLWTERGEELLDNQGVK